MVQNTLRQQGETGSNYNTYWRRISEYIEVNIIQSKVSAYLKPALISFGTAFLISPVLWLCSLLAGGAGHGTYIPFIIFFPYASLYMVVLWRLDPLIRGQRINGVLIEPLLYGYITPLALVTYFIYALLFIFVYRSHHKYWLIGILLFLHILIAIVAIVVGDETAIGV